MSAQRLALCDLPPGTLSDLYDYWLSKRADQRPAARADIDPLDFPWALGRVCLLAVTRQPLLFRYRLDGSLIADHRGRDMTGRTIDELRPLALANLLSVQYGYVVETAEPVYFRVRCRRGLARASYLELALPLAYDGLQVGMILVCALGTESIQPMYREATTV